MSDTIIGSLSKSETDLILFFEMTFRIFSLVPTEMSCPPHKGYLLDLNFYSVMSIGATSHSFISPVFS